MRNAREMIIKDSSVPSPDFRCACIGVRIVVAKLLLVRQVEDQKEDMTTLQERQKDLFETIKSLEKDIQVMNDPRANDRGHPR